MTRRYKKKKNYVLIVLIIFIFGIIGVSVYLSLNTDFFLISNVVVEGGELVSNGYIQNVADIPLENNIFSTQIAAIYDKIEQIEDFKDIKIIKQYPDTIKIVVTEKDTATILYTEKELIYLDKTDTIIYSSSKIQVENIPIITGLTMLSDNTFGTIAEIDEAKIFQDIKDMQSVFEIDQLLEKISEFNFTEDKNIVIYTNNKTTIRVANYLDFEENYQYIYTIINDNKGGMNIDFTTGEYPVVN
jgi:cell division septal protein FtsQ